MASAQRQPPDDLTRLLPLLRRPGRHGFLAVVDLLARTVGLDNLRFRHDPGLGFPAGELRHVLPIDLPPVPSDDPALPADAPPRRAYEVTATTFGLTGALGPVPVYLCELTVGDDESAALRRAFLAPFHDRLYSLWYRASRRTALPQTFETGAADGVGTLPLRHIPPVTLLRLAPLLVSRVRSARTLHLGLQTVAGEFLPPGAALTLEQFTGGWSVLGHGTQMQLGRPETLALGRSTVIGTRIRDPAAGLRIRVGPLPPASLPHFSPRGPAFERIRELVGLLVRTPLDVEVDLLSDGGLTSLPFGQLRLGSNFRLVAPGTVRQRHTRFRLADGAPLDSN
jgi:type VI secretion system ImpH/TssG family protein